MSSAAWAERGPAADLGLELALLCDALDMPGGGSFLFAICEEEGPLRARLMEQVRAHLEEDQRELIEVELSPDQPDLAGQLERRSLYGSPEEKEERLAQAAAELIRDQPRPPVVFVHTRGLADAGTRVARLTADHPDRARMEQARRALRALNFQRERLSRPGVPLVFWLSQNALGQVMQHAADVFAARGGLFFFETPRRTPGAPLPMRAEVIAGLLDRFRRTLLPPNELRRRAALYGQRLEREQAAEEPNWPRVALLCRDLANMYRELDDYRRAGEFQDRAIEAYEKAIAERGGSRGAEQQGGRGAEGQEWARLQVWLGNAYANRIRGERAENLARAIQCYREALTVYGPEAAPSQYAATQNNLGNAYSQLPTGDRAENLARATQCYQEALAVLTAEAFPRHHEVAARNLKQARSQLDRAGEPET